jgi:hypothetical protein
MINIRREEEEKKKKKKSTDITRGQGMAVPPNLTISQLYAQLLDFLHSDQECGEKRNQ